MRTPVLVLALFFAGLVMNASAASFRLKEGKTVTYSLPDTRRPVLESAADMLAGDMKNVFGVSLKAKSGKADIIVKIDPSEVLEKEGFSLKVTKDGRLHITGHDSHGAAYGMLELSRLFGVSPWEWWADATPEKRSEFELPEGYSLSQSPSVAFRGIFINDEDWGLNPWSSQTFEPGLGKGVIGPKTNEKIFQLLLRLRANYYWPAMHEVSEPFFLIPGNREMAEKYGIYIGGSHCEPMASSTAVEWGRRGTGKYDFINNHDNVIKFWEDRLKDVGSQEIVYTLGMRGVHDSAMLGATTIEEQKEALSRVLSEQRDLLSRYVSKDVESVPQVFVPYKEVLDVYKAGLEVPEDVALMWCDDNYGYIRHFPTPEEASRKGGNGIYYHISYWGRPHDYLWLGTFNPGLLYQQMNLAYDKRIRDMWILNVGDIKPAEYQTELFLDMAWDIDSVRKEGVEKHLSDFLKREFGEKVASETLPVMKSHYRLANIHKPEFMGNTRTEEKQNPLSTVVKDLPWSRQEIQNRLSDYKQISDKAEKIFNEIPESRKDEFFQLVKYPVQGAVQMNEKTLRAQLARHGEASWEASQAAYDSIVALTKIYNEGFHNNGKWNRMMDFQPRKLSVFQPVKQSEASAPMADKDYYVVKFNGTDATGDFSPCEWLGYEGKAVALRKKSPVSFNIPECDSDSLEVELRFVPTHPVVGEDLRVSIDNGKGFTSVVGYATKGRSEEWKVNVLDSQARKTVRIPKSKILTVTPLDEGVILDQIIIRTSVEP